MAKPQNETGIANLALGLLQNDPVVSISPPDADSKAAAVMAKWYDVCRLEVLEDHPWEFARRRLSVAAESAAPAFEYSAAYELPGDYVRLARIGQNFEDPLEDYEIEGGYLLCNEASPLSLVYIKDFKLVTKMSMKFIMAVATKMASYAAMEITGNSALATRLGDEYMKILTTGASISGQNRPPRRVQRSRFRAARQRTTSRATVS